MIRIASQSKTYYNYSGLYLFRDKKMLLKELVTNKGLLFNNFPEML
jgi:hypothetical protein